MAEYPKRRREGRAQLREREDSRARRALRGASKSIAGDDTRKLAARTQNHRTEQKMQGDKPLRIREDLTGSRERYAELYDSAPVGYVTLDADGVILEANLTACGLLGANRQSLLSKPLHRWVCRNSQDAFDLHRQGVFGSEKKQRCELALRRPDGTVLDAELESVVVADEVGGFRRSFTILSDISERKQARLALLRKEAELNEAQRLAHVGSWHWDTKADVITTSDEMLRIFGFDPASETMPDFKEQRGRCFPVDDWERLNAAVQNTLEAGVGYELDLKALHNGKHIWIRTQGEVVQDADGEIVGLRGTVQDITERYWTQIRRKIEFLTTRALAEAESLAEAAPAILQVACESLGWTLGELWEVSPGEERLQFAGCWHSPSVPLRSFVVGAQSLTFKKGIGLPGKVWETRRPVWMQDVARDPAFIRSKAAGRSDLHSAFAYPILMGPKVTGVVAFFTREIHETPQDLTQVFAAVGAHIAQFIERKRAQEALDEERRRSVEALESRARQQGWLAELAHYALDDTGLDSVLRTTVTLVAQVLGVEFCDVLELQPDGDAMLMRAGTGWKKGCVGCARVPAGPESQAGFTLRAKEPVIVKDLRKEIRFEGSKVLRRHGIVSGISAVVHGRRRPYGVIGAHTKRRQDFSPDDLHFLQSTAHVLAAAIERRDLEEELLGISDREQQRIGQDLHDGLCQILAGLRMKAELVASEVKEDSEEKSNLDEIADSLAGAMAEARTLARGLCPVAIEAHGLMSALEELATESSATGRIDCQFACERPVLVDHSHVATHLYRIAQEAVRNAVRHGNAKSISMTLSRLDGESLLCIDDDGSGLPANAFKSQGMGIRIMAYRAERIGGSLEIGPRKPKGTQVVCTFKG